MTIAIAAYGRNAGKAVMHGMIAAELLGRGAIGGFTVFSVLDEQGEHRQSCSQTGGIAALENPVAYQRSECAAVISSGPNRPEPLSQFLVGKSGVGLVTGHRLPNGAGANGRPVNLAALDLLAGGISASEAIRRTLEPNPEVDAGLIAVKMCGPVAYQNTERVGRRHDALEGFQIEPDHGYAILCNSIYTAPDISLISAVGAVVWHHLTGKEGKFKIAHLAAPVPVLQAESDLIEIDDDNRVSRIHAADSYMVKNSDRVTAIYSGAAVSQNGRRIGRCTSEVIAAVKDGRVVPNAEWQSQFVVESSRDVATRKD